MVKFGKSSFSKNLHSKFYSWSSLKNFNEELTGLEICQLIPTSKLNLYTWTKFTLRSYTHVFRDRNDIERLCTSFRTTKVFLVPCCPNQSIK